MMAQAPALIACDCANGEKPLMLACFQIKSVTSIVVSRPAEYPSEVRTPPRASVASACPVRAPPTLSMTTSTPRRPVRRATPSVRLSAERSMTLSKPRARACSALAGVVVVGLVHDRGREILEAEARDELSKLDGERARGGGHRGQYGTTSRALSTSRTWSPCGLRALRLAGARGWLQQRGQPAAQGQHFRVGGGEPRSEERRVGKECRSRWSPYH